jgi:hypothetical protein
LAGCRLRPDLDLLRAVLRGRIIRILGVKPVLGLVLAGPAAAGPGPAVWVQDPDRDPAMVAEDPATAALALAGSALAGPARAGSVRAAAARALVSLA